MPQKSLPKEETKLPEPEIELPKPETDLPLPEKDLPKPINEKGQETSISENAFTTPITPFQPSYMWLKLLGLALVLILIFASSFALLQNNSSKTLPPSPTPTKVVDETANWKTYTGNDFSFKYPDNLIYYKENNTNGSSAASVVFGRKPTDKETATYKEWYQYSPPETLLWDSFVISQYSNKINADLSSYTNKQTLDSSSIENITVDGVTGKIFYWGCQSVCVDILFQKNNQVIKIYINNYQESQLSTVRKILSTFKFTDQKSQINTSTWKTYLNTKYSLSFNYPQNLSSKENQNVNISDPSMMNHEIISFEDIKDPLSFGFDFGVYGNAGNLSAKQFILQYFNKGNNDASGQPIDPELKDATFQEYNFNENKITIIDGLQTVVGRQGPFAWVTKGTNGYLFTTGAWDDSSVMLQNIISTFKFTP